MDNQQPLNVSNSEVRTSVARDSGFDVSQANYEQQIAALWEELQRKDEFFSNALEELRTPLSAMKTALKLLNSPQLKAAQRQRYLNLINQECDRQSALINSLFDLVQLDQTLAKHPLQPIKLSDVIPGLVSTYQPLTQEKDLRLAYTIPEQLPPVSCSETWLKQVTVHLLENAIKFTPTGGKIWVKAFAADPKELSTNSGQLKALKNCNPGLILEVRDTGIGIPPREIPKIFDRFYRVRYSSSEGTDTLSTHQLNSQSALSTPGVGLGLTLIQKILDHCGGAISVTSRVNEGSIFRVYLPLFQPPATED